MTLFFQWKRCFVKSISLCWKHKFSVPAPNSTLQLLSFFQLPSLKGSFHFIPDKDLMQFWTLENQLRCGIVDFACKLKYVFSFQAINLDSGQFQFQANLVRTCNIVTTSSNGAFNETTTFLIPVHFVITKVFLIWNIQFLICQVEYFHTIMKKLHSILLDQKIFSEDKDSLLFPIACQVRKMQTKIVMRSNFIQNSSRKFPITLSIIENNYNRFKSILLSAHQIISDHIKYFKS